MEQYDLVLAAMAMQFRNTPKDHPKIRYCSTTLQEKTAKIEGPRLIACEPVEWHSVVIARRDITCPFWHQCFVAQVPQYNRYETSHLAVTHRDRTEIPTFGDGLAIFWAESSVLLSAKKRFLPYLGAFRWGHRYLSFGVRNRPQACVGGLKGW
jgi:hypothetical protein